MANPNTPYGLVPIQRTGAAAWRDSLNMYYVPANTTNALYVGDPVIKVTGSADANGVNGVNLATAGTNHPITGVICGFVPQFALAGTPGPAYKPANATQAYYVLVNDDPATEYVIQSNDSGGNPAVTVVGKNANLASGSGSQYTGWSGWQLAANQIATTSTYQLNILGFLAEADNTPGSAHAKLIVRINQNTEVNGAAGI